MRHPSDSHRLVKLSTQYAYVYHGPGTLSGYVGGSRGRCFCAVYCLLPRQWLVSVQTSAVAVSREGMGHMMCCVHKLRQQFGARVAWLGSVLELFGTCVKWLHYMKGTHVVMLLWLQLV